jgi:uncharacterized RDD family membrane protein YckC
MSNFDILTSQNVSVKYDVAGVGNRIAATAIDYIFVGIWVLFISAIVQIDFRVTNPFVLVLLYSPVILYQLLMEIFFNGQSAGIMMMKIRVMKTDGSKPSVIAYLLRWMFRLVDITFSMGSVATIMIAFTEKAQRLGDLTAGTTVIRIKAKTKLRELVPIIKDENYQPVFSEVVALNDNDISLLKKVLFKRAETQDPWLMEKMVTHIKKATGINTEMADLQFLKTILADYEFYALQDKSII